MRTYLFVAAAAIGAVIFVSPAVADPVACSGKSPAANLPHGHTSGATEKACVPRHSVTTPADIYLHWPRGSNNRLNESNKS
jgi:hypothetical protein